MLAPDSIFFQQQLIHHICTAKAVDGQWINFDFTKTQPLPEKIAGQQFVMKLRSAARLQFKGENIKIISDSVIQDKDEFLYTITLEYIPENRTARIEYRKTV